MSVDKIRTALGLLFEDPHNTTAWDEIEEVVTGDGDFDVAKELKHARAVQERRQAWWVVGRLLELEVALADEPELAAQLLVERARILSEELCRAGDALACYQRALELDPDSEAAPEAIAKIEEEREKWEKTVEHFEVEAIDCEDQSIRVRMLVDAAETRLRFGPADEECLQKVEACLRQALEVDPRSRLALGLAAVFYHAQSNWEQLALVLRARASSAHTKSDKIAAAYRLAQVTRFQLRDEKLAVDAHGILLDLNPNSGTALSFLVDHYSKSEDWDHLVALYEDQLHSGVVKQSEEFGVWVQIAMLNWKTRKRPDAAEVYFNKVRRIDPTHVGMLQFFRDQCEQKGDTGRLMAILTDAQRAAKDPDLRRGLAEEIAGLAEGVENAKRAIDQYKTILRSDPDNAEARDKLKKLYLQSESYNALVELYRQDLNRAAKDDAEARVPILRDIASVYRDRMQSDTALLTVLTQILQLDKTDVEAVRGLITVYESLGRWRDLLNMQSKLAELTDSQPERISLLRAVARRWVDQFSNVQNAILAYEELLDATGDDVEAREKLRDLYKKRRAWPKLYGLYEQQLAATTGPKRIELMMEMAKLAAERVDKGAEAIRLLTEVLELDPEAEGVLDTLERQAERQKDHKTVAFVLEKRIEVADAKDRLALLQKLGALLADKLEDTAAASQAWRRVLDVSPGHKRALRVLRQSFVEAADWDGLSELYASQEDNEGLADFLSTTADRASDDTQKIELSFRAALVYEDELKAPERAVRSYERVLSIDEGNVRAALALLPLYEVEEKWSRLPGLYQVLLSETEDVDEKIDILHKIADITGGPLANKAAALSHARQAYELRPDEEGLKRLQTWSQQSGEWSAFIEVIRGRLDDEDVTEDRARELKLMLAEVYATEVGKLDEAVKMYRTLVEEDPADTRTVSALEELLRGADRRDDLRWLFGLKVDRFEGDERCGALEEWAAVEEEVFGEPARAIELLQGVVEEDPTRATALGTLTRLLLAAEDWKSAAQSMISHRDASEGDERVALETELAQLYLEKLEQPLDAYDACVRALDEDEQNSDAIALLEELMGDNRARAKAAASLEQIYASSGASEKQVGALTALLEQEDDGERRLELCLRLAHVHEHDLEDPSAAFEVILNTMLEAPAELQLWDRAQELCAAAGSPTDLAEAYRTHLGEDEEEQEDADPLSEELRLELCERAASLHATELGDSEGAVPYLEQILGLEPTHERAFDSLKEILNAVERWNDLEKLYLRAIGVAEDEEQRIELLHDVALVAEEMIGNDDKAISYYERIIAIDSLYENAVEALERLYSRAERFEQLTTLLERKLETATDKEAAPIQLQLVDLYLHQLEKHDKVMGHLESVLALRQDDAEARELAEDCLEVEELRQPAAALLDGVYELRDDVRDLVRVLDVRLEGAEDGDQKRQLLTRIATLRDERLKDDAGAFEALCVLVPLEPDDSALRERFLEVGERLEEHGKLAEALTKTAEKCSVPPTRGEILMAAARLYRNELEQNVRAEEVYRQVLEIDPDDPMLVIPAAKALGEIHEVRGEHEKLAEVLSIQVRLVGDIDQSATLYERIANLYEDILEDQERTIGAWKARLSDDNSDGLALRSLERLYGQSEQWRELVEVLHQLEQSADDGDERRRCMVRSAEVLSDRLAETTDAINAWRAVLDDFGPETDTLAALSKLYRKAERWDDLAEVHDVWLSLTDEIEERVELYAGLADVRFQNLGDSQGALTAYHEVLRLDPVHEGARTALELMLEHEDPDIKREAAEIIGPLYEADGDAERLLKVLNIEIDSTFEPASRLATLDRALRTAEDVVENVDQAFDYAARGVREALGEPALAEWISTAERLAAETERWRDLLDLFEQVVGEMLDAEIQQHTRLRAGELARTMLEDNERATKHYRAALDAQGDDRDAMLALEELYGEADNNVDLLEILQLRAESSEQDEDRIELLLRVAKLQAGPLEERAAAIETYEDLIDLDLLDEAVASLEQLYRDAEQYEQVVSLCERQLDVNDGSRSAELRVRIAKVAHKHLSDTGRALEELGEALGVDPMHEGAITVLESLLDEAEEPDQRGQVAEMLEPVYLRQADWGKLRLVIDARLDTSQDPSERGELLTRLATLYEEQLEDYAMALETVARRLREEPGDENIWAEVERLGRVIGSESEKRVAEIFADALNEVGADDPKTAALCERTGELFAAVEQHDDALTWYRRAYAFSPESQELFKSIDEHLIELEQHQARVDHYRESLDHIFEDELRVERLSAIAKLQRDSLEQASEAIDTFVELLDIDDANAVALDALTDLFKETKQDEELAELYQRRADLADSPEVGAPYRLALAKLLGSKEEERDRALEQLEIVVIDLPWDESAIAQLEEMLEDEERKARVIDILRPLYEHANNWRGIIALNEQRLALADEPLEQVDILNETAMLWEDQGDDLQEAFDVVQKAFELQPDNDDTRANLERLTEAVEAWERLANSYERVANELQDAFVQQQMINALATICDERLDDPRRALRALGMLSALDPSNGEPLERMDDLCMLLGDWSTLATVLERKSENALDEDEKASMLRRLGEIKCDMLDDEPGAVETFEQALELAPENLIVLDQLIELYKTGKPQRLVELLEQRIDASSEEDEELRHGLLTQAAEVFERELDDRSEAVRVLQRALDARPTEGGVLSNLERLFRAEEMYDELLDNLKTQANVAEETSTRRDLRDKIGDLYISQFDNAHDALEQYRLVLEEDDTDQHAITAARKIGENYEELRLDVSALLEPVLSGAGRFDELLDIMELRFAAQGDPQERARTLTGMAMIQEEQLDAPETARDTLLRALQETPEDGALHDDIERLCELTDDHGKYADVLEQRADSILDAQVQTDLFSRFGRIAETRLKQPERAIEAYNKALEQAERPAELLEALDRLYEQTGDADKLASVIERRVDIEEGDTTQAELYFRLGKIQIVDFGDKPQGLSTLRMCVDLNPEHEGARDELKKLTDDEELFEEVAEALDVMYRVAQDSASRAWLRNKRISYAPSPEERIRLRLELAQMLEDESFDTASAQDVIQQALFDDASSEELMTQLERLAKTNAAGNLGGEAWRRAADALGKVVAAAFDVEEGDAREMSPTQARDLHLRAAGWYDEQVGDPDAAEKRLLLALEHDTQSSAALLQLEQLHRAPDREKDLVATLRRLAALAQSNAGEMDREPAELRREAKILAETALENQELAEEILREMLEANDADTWALGELSTIIEAKKDFEELYALLTRHIELASEADQLRELRHHAAKVAADELDQRDAAIDLYEQAFEDEPADADASSALRTLYQKLERHEDMLRLTERLIDLSESPEARAELRLESAQICISILEAPTEGIEHLRAVLDEVPGHDAAVELLGGLLEKEGRDEELAELLGRQITFARDNEDQEAELGYRVQLAELYETRLNDPNRAIDSYLAVLETDASFRPALESLARLYEGQDQTASAAKTYEKLIEAASQEELTRLALKARDLYVAVDEQAAASRVLETVLGSERSLSADEKQQLRDGLRSLYRNQSAWQELADLTVLEAGEAESEDEKVVLYRKAAALHAGERNDHAAAAELLEKALELKSEDRDLMLQLCDEYTASSRGRDAVAVLNQVVESYGGRRSKDLADIHHRIASAYRADGDDDAALRELESARKMDPGSIEVLTELGQLSIAMADQDNGAKSEHIKRAGNMFRSLLLQRLDDSSVISKAEVFYHLAEVNQREDDKKKAIHNLERALANDKTLEKARTLLDALKS